MIDWGLMSQIVAVFAAVAGLLKYVFYLLDKHNERINERFDLHQKKIDDNAQQAKMTAERLAKTREEMNRDFVRHDHLDKTMREHGTILNNIFSRINAMARDLNQLIGAQNGNLSKPDNEG